MDINSAAATKVVEGLRAKGYSESEIARALAHLHGSAFSDTADGAPEVTPGQAPEHRYSHPAKPESPDFKLKQATAEAFGVDPSQIDFEGPLGRERFQLGMLDSPESKQQYLSGQYPAGAEIVESGGRRHVPYQRPDGTVSFANPPGYEHGDVPEFYSREGPAIAAGYLGGGALAGNTVKSMLGVLGGASAGETVRRGLLRPAAGGEDLSAQDISPIAAIGALEAIGGPVVGKATRAPANVAMGRGVVEEGPMRDHLLNISRLDEVVDDLPMPPATRMGESLVLGSTEKQLGSTTIKLDQKFREGQRKAVNELKEMMLGEQSQNLRGEIRSAAKEYMDVAEASLRWPLARTETGGKSAVSAMDRWSKKSKGSVNKLYAQADVAAQKEAPVFDLSGIDTTKYEIRGTAAPAEEGFEEALTGAVEPGDVVEYINVAKDPEGRVARVLNLIDKLDPEQADYRVVKELRSQVGKAIDSWPWDADRGTGIARSVYRDLSEILNNPTNGAEGFVVAHRAASAAANHRFGVLDDAGYRSAMTMGVSSPARLAVRLADDPTSVTPALTEALTKNYNAEDLATLQLSMMDRLVSKGGSARAALKDWWNQNPAQARQLFKGQYSNVRKVMLAADTLNSKKIAGIADNLGDRIDVSKMLVEGLDDAGARQLVKDYGGRGSRGHELLRLSAHERIVDSVVKFDDDLVYIDVNRIKGEIQKAQDSGVWKEIFTKGDRQRLEGLSSYAYLMRKGAGDTGTSLQRAAAVANLRHPATFMKGVHTLTVNRLLGTALASDKLSRMALKFRLGTGKKPIAKSELNALGMFMTGVADYWGGLREQP